MTDPASAHQMNLRINLKAIGLDYDDALRRVQFSMPLTLEQQRILFEIATGQRIVIRKRCKRCDGVGRIECGLSGWKPECEKCDGGGYEQ